MEKNQVMAGEHIYLLLSNVATLFIHAWVNKLLLSNNNQLRCI